MTAVAKAPSVMAASRLTEATSFRAEGETTMDTAVALLRVVEDLLAAVDGRLDDAALELGPRRTTTHDGDDVSLFPTRNLSKIVTAAGRWTTLWSLMRWPGSMESRTTMGIVAWRVIISCTRLWRPWSKLSMSSPSARRATRDAEVRVGATKAWHAVAASSTTRRDIRDVEVIVPP